MSEDPRSKTTPGPGAAVSAKVVPIAARPSHSSISRGPWVFFGPNGLRAGWSILVFAVVCFIFIMFCGSLVGRVVPFKSDFPMKPLDGMLMELSQLVPVIIATCLMAFLERRPVLFYGFQGSARIVRFASGIVWGFVGISGLVFLLHHFGYLSIDGRTLSRAASLRYAAEWGVMFLLVGLCEESIFRGYAQFTITRGIGFWWGAFLFAALFGFMHHTNAGESPVGLLGAGGASLIFCLSLWYTGSLWWAVGFHAAWDWGQSYFYGTADSGMVASGHLLRAHPAGKVIWSGGATGPEGSIMVVPLLLVVALGMALWWGLRGGSPFAGAAWKPGRIAAPGPAKDVEVQSAGC